MWEAFLTTCRDAGRPLAIVSNNTGASVRAYLDGVGLTGLVQHIEARDASDPALMKPSPHLIERAAQALAVEPDACTLIGDQATDRTGRPCDRSREPRLRQQARQRRRSGRSWSRRRDRPHRRTHRGDSGRVTARRGASCLVPQVPHR
ncbi:HAD family hydrolase [Kribbella sp. NPDC058693]|uniref:HAD family hydrolase n=1 Tax=Kribbella sp. NPDC058693 TaxID=3346602 RepID=UPI0036617F05